MRSLYHFILTISLLTTAMSCGSGGGSPGEANIEGPDINLSEAQELRLNQIYLKEWTGDDTRPFLSVYIQDDLSKDYMVCAGPDNGLDVASQAGVYYGALDIPMVKVDGAEDHDTPVFNIVIVANQDDPCPAAIADNDQIVGTVRINFGELLDLSIEFGDGEAYVAFKARGHDDIDPPELDPSATDALVVGELYFRDNNRPTDIIPNYYMVLYVSDGAVYRFHSMIDPEEMPEMREPQLIYSKLTLAFPDTDGIGSDNVLLKTKARVELQRDDAVLVGRAAADYLGDIIGQKVEFEEGNGYIKFRRIAE